MRIHFIAIGGAIMHQLAIALYHKGYTITGSDDEINDPAKTNLKQYGLLPDTTGWQPDKIQSSIDAIVLGMHAKEDNPELLKAQELHIPIYSFPEYIFEISKEKQRIVVAGSHGKTTITSMIMHILQQAGKDFDYLVGAKVQGFKESVRLSDAPLIVLEGDEYPASVIEKKPKIFFYQPHISVLSGIAWDHINVFPTYENYCSQFETYLMNMDAGATVFFNAEDEEVLRIIQKSGKHLNTIPYKMPAYYYKDGTAFIKTAHEDIALAIFGKHNILNTQAAIAVCTALGIPNENCYKAISSYAGAAKRMELLFEKDNIIAYRDFAHAPSKLKATLTAVREAYPHHHLIACYELHTYSSLNQTFITEYKHSMKDADAPIVYFSKHALNLKRLPDLSPEKIKEYFDDTSLIVCNDKNILMKTVQETLAQTDRPVCLLLMSSGTYDGINWNDVCSQSN